jgi:hypothetical protein
MTASGTGLMLPNHGPLEVGIMTQITEEFPILDEQRNLLVIRTWIPLLFLLLGCRRMATKKEF